MLLKEQHKYKLDLYAKNYVFLSEKWYSQSTLGPTRPTHSRLLGNSVPRDHRTRHQRLSHILSYGSSSSLLQCICCVRVCVSVYSALQWGEGGWGEHSLFCRCVVYANGVGYAEAPRSYYTIFTHGVLALSWHCWRCTNSPRNIPYTKLFIPRGSLCCTSGVWGQCEFWLAKVINIIIITTTQILL